MLFKKFISFTSLFNFLFFLSNNSTLRQYFINALKRVDTSTKMVYNGNATDILILCFVTTLTPYLPFLYRICGPNYFRLSDEAYFNLFCELISTDSGLPENNTTLHAFYGRKLRRAFKSQANTNFWIRLIMFPHFVFGPTIGGEFLAYQLTEYAKKKYDTRFPVLHPANYNPTIKTSNTTFNIFQGIPTLASRPLQLTPSVILITSGVEYPDGSLYAPLCLNFIVDTSTLFLSKNNSLNLTTSDIKKINYESFSVKLIRVTPNLPISEYPVFLNDIVIGVFVIPKTFSRLVGSTSVKDVFYDRQPPRINVDVIIPKVLTQIPLQILEIDIVKKISKVVDTIPPDILYTKSIQKTTNEKICEFFETNISPTTSLDIIAASGSQFIIDLPADFSKLKTKRYRFLQDTGGPSTITEVDAHLEYGDTNTYDFLFVDGVIPQHSLNILTYETTSRITKPLVETFKFLAPKLIAPKLTSLCRIVADKLFIKLLLSCNRFSTTNVYSAIVTISDMAPLTIYENPQTGCWIFVTIPGRTCKIKFLDINGYCILDAVHQIDYESV